MSNQSTDEGQQVVASEAVLGPQEGNETPGNLEPENGENGLQNLEEKGPMVAQDDGLEAALEESAGAVIDAEFEEVDEAPAEEWPTHCSHGTSIKEPCEKCKAADMGKDGPNVKALQEAYGSANFSDPPSEAAVSIKIRGVDAGFHIGLQPDGSTKVVVTIEEGYWEAVQQWAEADGVPVERWLSDRLYEYISTYGEPAKGR